MSFLPEKTGPALNRRVREVASSGNWFGCYGGTAHCRLYYCIAREGEEEAVVGFYASNAKIRGPPMYFFFSESR